MNEEKEIKKTNKLVIIIPIIVGVLLIAVGAFLLLGTKSSKSENENNEVIKQDPTEDLATPYEGIYEATNDKMYIRKISNTEFHYILGGNFEGSAIINGNSAKEKNPFKDDEYFEFKLKDDGIELIYHADENTEVALDTGLYKKIAEYSKDNIYKEAVGDPEYLETNHNGLYKNGDIELYVYQISENEIVVKSSNNTTDTFIDEKFVEQVNEANGEISYNAKSFFDEDKIAYSLKIYDNSIEITVYDDVFEFDDDDKKLENSYTFDKKITKEEIMNEFYSNY